MPSLSHAIQLPIGYRGAQPVMGASGCPGGKSEKQEPIYTQPEAGEVRQIDQ